MQKTQSNVTNPEPYLLLLLPLPPTYNSTGRYLKQLLKENNYSQANICVYTLNLPVACDKLEKALTAVLPDV